MGNVYEKGVKLCNGYIDEVNQIAYSKRTMNIDGKDYEMNGWEATDIKTGIKFAEGDTRNKCINNSIESLEALNNLRNGKTQLDYDSMCKTLTFLIGYGKWASEKLIKRKTA